VPIAHFHLTHSTEEQRRRLLTEGSRRYADVLDSPIERVRAFVHRLPPEDAAVGGQVVADGDTPAVYFTALMLRGRPVEKRHRLLAEFTDLLVEVLGVERSAVRGLITEIDPDGWGIAGVPASVARGAEIAAREADGAP
jgi:4-oxalocrotonate tautomerase family enzyme